jgi:hypothetical protein
MKTLGPCELTGLDLGMREFSYDRWSVAFDYIVAWMLIPTATRHTTNGCGFQSEATGRWGYWQPRCDCRLTLSWALGGASDHRLKNPVSYGLFISLKYIKSCKLLCFILLVQAYMSLSPHRYRMRTIAILANKRGSNAAHTPIYVPSYK